MLITSVCASGSSLNFIGTQQILIKFSLSFKELLSEDLYNIVYKTLHVMFVENGGKSIFCNQVVNNVFSSAYISNAS